VSLVVTTGCEPQVKLQVSVEAVSRYIETAVEVGVVRRDRIDFRCRVRAMADSATGPAT